MHKRCFYAFATLIFFLSLYCNQPTNPFTDCKNASLEFHNSDTAVCELTQLFTCTLGVSLPDLIDSIVVSFGADETDSVLYANTRQQIHVTHLFASAGIKNITATGYAGDCQPTASAFIDAGAKPYITNNGGIQVSSEPIIGSSFEMTVTLTQSGAFTYQWYKDSIAISSANGNVLRLNSLTATDSGSYFCIVANDYGTQSSAPYNLVPQTSSVIPQKVTLAVTVAGNGTVYPPYGEYTKDTLITLTATPDSGWVFSRWDGDAAGLSLTYDLSMDVDKSVEAYFSQLVMRHVVVADSGEGSVSVADTLVPDGSYLTVTATPVSGVSYFSRWDGDTSSTSPSFTVLVNKDLNLTAYFPALPSGAFSLTTNIIGQGTVEPLPTGNAHAAGTNVTLFAHAQTGWAFEAWSGDTGRTHLDTAWLTMDTNKIVTAAFTQKSYILTVDPNSGSLTNPSASQSPVTANALHGAQTAIAVAPPAGYDFAGWTVTVGAAAIEDSLSAATTVTLTAGNATVQARFAVKTYQLTISAGAGTLQKPASATTTVNHGAATEIEVTPPSGYVFSGWTVTTGAAVVGNPALAATTVTLTEGNATITAAYSNVPAISVSTTALSPSCLAVASALGDSFDVWNGGTGSIAFAAASEAAWISLSPDNGTSAGASQKTRVYVSYSTSTMNAGTYTDSILVTSAGLPAKKITVSLTITAVVGFASATTSRAEGNSASTANITVSLTRQSSQAVTVQYALLPGGTAVPGRDFTLTDATLTIPAGSLNAQIPVSIPGNTIDQNDGTVIIGLSLPGNAVLSATTTHTLTITDDDAVPTIGIASHTAVPEGYPDTLYILLSSKSWKPVSAGYYTFDGTALAGTNYTAVNSGSVSFDTGQTEKIISIPTVHNATWNDDDLVFSVRLRNPVNADTLAATKNVTIDDLDAPESGAICVRPAGTGNGSSWPHAMGDLQAAITAANSAAKPIWIASGTYKPTSGTDRALSFDLGTVEIYGGFRGGEVQLAQRNIWRNDPAILSGDIGTQGDNNDNSYTVMLNGARLDGVTVEKGNNTGSGGGYSGSAVLMNCIFRDNHANANGGGVIMNTSASVWNCVFANNTCSGDGAAFCASQSARQYFYNCIFYKNSAVTRGAAIHTITNGTNITHCTFYGNSAPQYAVCSNSSTTTKDTVRNSLIWGNGSAGVSDFRNSSVTEITGSIIDTSGKNSMIASRFEYLNYCTAIYPLFSDTTSLYGGDGKIGGTQSNEIDGLTLQTGSPAINHGITGLKTPADIIGYNRNGTANPQDCDAGAYER